MTKSQVAATVRPPIFKIAVFVLFLGIIEGVGCQERVQGERQGMTDAIIKVLDRLPSNYDTLLLAINDKKTVADDSELQRELKKGNFLLAVGAAGTAGLPTESAKGVEEFQWLQEFAVVAVFCETKSLDDLKSYPEIPGSGVLLISHLGEDAEALRKKYEPILERAFAPSESVGDLKLRRSLPTNKRKSAVLSGWLDKRYFLAISAETKDLERLASPNLNRKNHPKNEILTAVKRNLDSLRTKGVLQVARTKRGSDNVISTYFPSSKETLMEVRRYINRIPESTEEGFKEQIGKPITPTPDWALQGWRESSTTVHVNILDEYSYEVRRTTTDVKYVHDLARFYWLARFGDYDASEFFLQNWPKGKEK